MRARRLKWHPFRCTQQAPRVARPAPETAADAFLRLSLSSLARLKAQSLTIDGEAVVLCPKTGLSLFDRLHSGRHDREVILYAFDLLELNGKDLRSLPLEQRKTKLAKLLRPISGGSSIANISRRTGPPCSVTPASSAARASYRSDVPHSIAQAERRHGSK